MTDQVLRPRHHADRLLSEVAEHINAERSGLDVPVRGVALHTASVRPGDIFVALQGAHRHGVELWESALSAGASAIFTDQLGASALAGAELPVLVAENPRDILGSLSGFVYGTGGTHPPVFSVTGTNGKTSSAYLLEAIMRALGWKTALSTTAERRVDGVAYHSTLTTPEAPDVHAMLALAAEQGVGGVAIEVSAQALSKNRLGGVMSAVAGFTNLSHDHFEDFGGMERYLDAKAALFEPDAARSAVVCVDGEWGQTLAARVQIPLTTVSSEASGKGEWTYSVEPSSPTLTHFRITSPAGDVLETHAPIVGAHMVANAALAIVMIVQGGVAFSELIAAIGPGTEGIPVAIPGRLERVSGPSGPAVFLDAGRSEDAYRQTLTAVRDLTPGTVVMVCGTSGNRDATKRPLMGAAAAELADVVIVTDDDPRREDPGAIRAGLLQGARSIPGATVHEVPDPNQAIRLALSMVAAGDSVVWSGPGSQNYRDIGGEKIPYSATREAQVALAEAGWAPGKGTP